MLQEQIRHYIENHHGVFKTSGTSPIYNYGLVKVEAAEGELETKRKFICFIDDCNTDVQARNLPAAKVRREANIRGRVTELIKKKMKSVSVVINSENVVPRATINTSSSSSDAIDPYLSFDRNEPIPYANVSSSHDDIVAAEFNKYLTLPEENIDSKNGALDWWKRNEREFPILSRVVPCVFGVQICSGGLERCFCAGNEVVTRSRSSLSDEMVILQMLLKINFMNLPDMKDIPLQTTQSNYNNQIPKCLSNPFNINDLLDEEEESDIDYDGEGWDDESEDEEDET